MRKVFPIILILGAVAVFVWPTRYRNYAAGEGPYAEAAHGLKTPVDRTTGAVYVFSTAGEWRPLKGARPELLRPDITGPRVSVSRRAASARKRLFQTHRRRSQPPNCFSASP